MGTLFIVATPIGNLEDITIRAIKTLFSVPFVACENTSHTGLLLSELEKRYGTFFRLDRKPKLVRFDDHTEGQTVPELIQRLENGEDVALVSDAGTPLVSDPGFKLVSAARSRDIRVISVPGASATLTALTSSGLSLDSFFFLGFPPEKAGSREKLFANLKQTADLVSCTFVMYVAPHKLETTLLDMLRIFGDIKVVLAHELTKIHESTWTGTLTEALEKHIQIKGEIVLLFRLT